jgi:16S rRNA (cytosine967-C5)-methyltransferase
VTRTTSDPTPITLFRAWLGAPGTRPPPLDRFLAVRKPSETVVHALDRLVRRSVSLVERPAPGGEALVSQLRALSDAALGRAMAEALPPELARARTQAKTWAERCVAWGIPPGFAPHLAARAAKWGEDTTLAWLARQDVRPPLWIRVRTPEVVELLRAQGFVLRGEGPAYALEGRADPRVLLREGGFEIQDWGSQQVGALADLRRGQRAWDVCAGRGGKTVQLGDALGGRGVVVATDIDGRKLAELKVRARRAGLADVIRVRDWDGSTPPDFGREGRGGFDVVLVDAPCSASGTWRRNPDARLRTDPARVSEFPTLQRSLLAMAAAQVAPGGRLVYGTCSVFVDEDEALSPGPGFTLVRAELFGAPQVDSDTLFGAMWVRDRR